jgi:hypothetical protein
MPISANILGKQVPVKIQDTIPEPVWENVIAPRLGDFQAITNHSADHLSQDQRATFTLTDHIAVFTQVKHGPYVMTRSFMDETNRRFFWAYDDLTSAGYSPPNRIPCYYYHDAHHIRQWLAGDRDSDLEKRVDREVEATLRQIEVAKAMRCDSAFIDWLTSYARDRDAIRARLYSGVGLFAAAGADHVPVLRLEEAPRLLDPPSDLPESGYAHRLSLGAAASAPGGNVALVRAIYDAFAAGDIPGVVSRMSPDIVWNEAENFPYADGNPYRGSDAILGGVFARLGGEWDGFAAVPEEFLDAGDTVVVLGRYRGTYKATGRALDAQLVHVWRVEGGKAAAFQQYTDTLQAARVTGGA